MDGGQVGVLKEGDEVCLGGLLESHDGGGLEAEVGLRGIGLDRGGSREDSAPTLKS